MKNTKGTTLLKTASILLMMSALTNGIGGIATLAAFIQNLIKGNDFQLNGAIVYNCYALICICYAFMAFKSGMFGFQRGTDPKAAPRCMQLGRYLVMTQCILIISYYLGGGIGISILPDLFFPLMYLFGARQIKKAAENK